MSAAPFEMVGPERLEAIRQAKCNDPSATYKDLRMVLGESEYAIAKALKGYTPE